jgi:penicillin-binding protein 1C
MTKTQKHILKILGFFSRRWIKWLLITLGGGFLVFMGLMYFVVPRPLFNTPYSPVVYASDGELLGARVAADEQWRLQMQEAPPSKYIQSVVTYEDKRFFRHFGVDPFAIARALRQNIRSGGVQSGGSTLTMQCVRLARGNPRRSFYEKCVEACWAVYIEMTYSKAEILRLYAAHAPFGGNVVGLESASWRYFGRDTKLLSWAECASLAVLPNAPALIHPGRNRERWKAKRDGLLLRLYDRGYIDRENYELAVMEPLPEAPQTLPNKAPHLLERLTRERPGQKGQSSVQGRLQREIQDMADRYARNYQANQLHNIAAIVADVESGEVLAYVGNVSFDAHERHGNKVDVIMAPRSTGSILKPFLYAAMLQDGLLLPEVLVSDTPLNIGGFMPQNFNRQYHGAVPARRAIERSLNVPLVRMLGQYHTGRFLHFLRDYGMTTLPYSEDHYGASLILGGAEGRLWDLVGMYASMSRTLLRASRSQPYQVGDVRPLSLYPADTTLRRSAPKTTEYPLLSAAAIWFSYEAMLGVQRPEEEAGWQQFSSMKKIAWKTGTSYGGRDAWAIGTTPRYVVGVWVGNASGEGRPNLTGVGYAAPLLFDIFSLLPGGDWFSPPYQELTAEVVCRKSGYRASAHCEEVDTVYIPTAGAHFALCPFHKQIHLSPDGQYRVNSSCEAVENMLEASWFVLPPSQEYYYKNFHADYRLLPPMRPGCEDSEQRQLEVIYPDHNSLLSLPRGFSGQSEKFVFKAAHTRSDAVVYWHIDDNYLGETVVRHEISCAPGLGAHTLTLVDDRGYRRSLNFEVR